MARQLIRWHWTASRLAERAGPVGVAAAVVLAGALLAWFAMARAIAAETRDVEADNDALHRRAALAARPASAPLTSAQQLAAFERAFPDERALGASYARLWALAQRHGVVLRQAEFKFSDAPQDEFQRYTMLLPVKADYAALRGFVVEALGEQPGLALEDMSLRREDSKSLQLDARLSFVLFVRRRST
jgi:hypothetical protein